MQKHIQTKVFSFVFGITFLLVPELANAGIISLPRYTGEFAYRTNSGGRDQTCSASYKYTCSGTGYSGGSGTACGDKYQSCICAANYKWSGGSCTLKTCADYGYSASKDTTKSCEEKTPRSGLTCYVCTSCNSTTYKYSCSGGLNATEQGTDNKCGTSYSECACVEHASWNASTGKCECGSDYKASGTSCTLKTCDDYGYSATEDKTKNCSKQTPRSGLDCWSCSDCTGTLYDCGNITNATGGFGTACGGKYPKCKCKSGYFWDNGKCSLVCTPKACTASDSCAGQSCTIFKSSKITSASELGTGTGTYAFCTPTNCSGSSNQYGYLPTGCADGYAGYDIGSCAAPMSTDCDLLGYKTTSCSSEQNAIKCPFGNKYVCFDKPAATEITCDNGQVGWILYGDGSCSSEVVSGVAPVAVITDETERLAVSLTFINKEGVSWDGTYGNTISGLPQEFYFQWAESGSGDVSGLENCYVGMMGFYGCGSNGKANTQTIIEYDGGKNIHHAAIATLKFKPRGCRASFCQRGKWWLPSNMEIYNMKSVGSTVNDGLYTVRNIMTTSPVDEEDAIYWSSTESNTGGGAGAFTSKEYFEHGKYEGLLVRPIVKY